MSLSESVLVAQFCPVPAETPAISTIHKSQGDDRAIEASPAFKTSKPQPDHLRQLVPMCARNDFRVSFKHQPKEVNNFMDAENKLVCVCCHKNRIRLTVFLLIGPLSCSAFPIPTSAQRWPKNPSTWRKIPPTKRSCA